jgi:hypothetical protein
MRPGTVAVQRTYPRQTYVTHIVCPGREWKRPNPTGVQQPRTTDKQEKE